MDARTCPHPISALRDATAETSGNTITIRATCGQCSAPITKQFLTRAPEPTSARFTTPVSEMATLGGAFPARRAR
ncbi:MAG TPA: hypothetical protein VKW06_08975 [Candidatus Angelobacter sp.]|nr:hypothetical protein [Candidatus Angelobacter sp.]